MKFPFNSAVVVTTEKRTSSSLSRSSEVAFNSAVVVTTEKPY